MKRQDELMKTIKTMANAITKQSEEIVKLRERMGLVERYLYRVEKKVDDLRKDTIG